MTQPVRTPIDPAMLTQQPNFLQRVGASIKYSVLGITPETWFSPSQPMLPVAQQAKGRQFDYPVGYNLQITPRAYEPVKFPELRQLADGYDLMRLAIETVKDQIGKYEWTIKTRESVTRKPNKEQQSQISEISDFLTYPDKINNWDGWLRMLLEEMLVLDAATIYPRRTRGGGIYSLDVMAGDTIKPVIDEFGRLPEPPSVAYQQIIKGLPAVDYSADELVYQMRNPRANRVYGLSPVAQVIVTVNIALRRQLVQLNHFTEGNIPEAIIGVPEQWTPDQIKELQTFWDSVLQGNLAERSKAKFVPSPLAIHEMRPNLLKDDFDEWLARIISYAFSLSPQALVKQMNRATSENARTMAIEEGQSPRLKWIKGVMDGIIWKQFGYRDIEFDWKFDEKVSPTELAAIQDMSIKNGSLSIDEVRDENGKEALGIGNFIMTAQGPLFIKDLINQEMPINTQAGGSTEAIPGSATSTSKEKIPEPPAKTEKLEKARKVKPINRNRKAALSNKKSLEKIFDSRFKAWKAEAKKIDIESFQKAEKTQEEMINEILANIEFSSVDLTADEISALLSKMAVDGVEVALLQIGVASEAVKETLVGPAVDYARKRGAELVGKKWIEGKLVDNPRAGMSILESTREFLRTDIMQALEEGWSNKKLADKIENNYAFSGQRSETIARTETAKADCQGNLIAYKESGLVMGKQWLVGSQHDDEDECDENEAAGTVGIDDVFPSGDETPPQHPRCVCSYIPVLKD
jgi:hypothetical protein